MASTSQEPAPPVASGAEKEYPSREALAGGGSHSCTVPIDSRSIRRHPRPREGARRSACDAHRHALRRPCDAHRHALARSRRSRMGAREGRPCAWMLNSFSKVASFVRAIGCRMQSDLRGPPRSAKRGLHTLERERGVASIGEAAWRKFQGAWGTVKSAWRKLQGAWRKEINVRGESKSAWGRARSAWGRARSAWGESRRGWGVHKGRAEALRPDLCAPRSSQEESAAHPRAADKTSQKRRPATIAGRRLWRGTLCARVRCPARARDHSHCSPPSVMLHELGASSSCSRACAPAQ